MSNNTLRGLPLILAGSLLVASTSYAVDWNHNPDSEIGPPHWGELDPGFVTCGVGVSQSPVDIAFAATAHGGGAALVPRYLNVPLEVENNGHAIEVPYAHPDEPTSLLKIGNDLYQLLQFHFHAPSEHEVDGVLADMELHLVHRNVATGQLAVVGVLLVAAEGTDGIIDEIIANAPLAEGTNVVPDTEINALELLPGFDPATYDPELGFPLEVFWNYSGSLTTPPCSENVNWYVLQDTVEVSPETVATMHQIISLFPHSEGYPNSNRPVQPLNGRVIVNHGD